VRLAAVKESGQEIHRLIKDTYKRLKVSQGLPDWKTYVDSVNNLVVAGLVNAMCASLKILSCNLNPLFIEQQKNSPLLEIQVDWN